MLSFSETLRRLRRDAGFASSRAFYRGRGGERAFGCTYKAYLNVEAGRSIPQSALALKILEALDAARDPKRLRDFVSSYLRSVLGRADLADFLARAAGAGEAAEPQSLLQKATETSFSTRAKPLTHEQAELLYRDAPAYWCFALLSNDLGHWDAAEVARRLGYPLKRVRSAMKALVEAALLSEDRGGRFFCPDCGKVFLYPREKFFMPRTLASLKGHWDTMAKSRGKTLFDRAVVLRASEGRLREYFPALAQKVYNAHLFCTDRAGRDTGIFVAEASVRRLRAL